MNKVSDRIAKYIAKEEKRIQELVDNIPCHYEYKKIKMDGAKKQVAICCYCKKEGDLRTYRYHYIHSSCEEDYEKCPWDKKWTEINNKYK